MNIILKEAPNTKMRGECMTLSLNMVSIKMEWQNQANKYNIPKQHMH